MSNVKQFTVGGVTYNAAMATAVDQDRLLSLLTAPIMERALGAAKLGKNLDDAVLVPMFMAMPNGMKTQTAQILIGRVTVAGGAVPVTVEDFGGRMVHYNTLLSQLLVWNLSDFFDWLPAVLVDAQAESKLDKAASTGI